METLEKSKEKEKYKYEKLALITFVGFREHLSVGFINNINISNETPKRVYLFTSSPRQSGYDERTYETTRNHIEKCMESSRRRFGENVEIKIIELDDIWEINKIYPRLNVVEESRGIVNISAGPSTFSVSLLLWVMNRPKFLLSHVKEIDRTIDSKPGSYEFKIFNIIPYMNLILNLDEQSRKLIEIIGKNNMRIRDIQKIMNEGVKKKDQMPYRSLYEKLRHLEYLKIIEIFKNRYLRVRVSDDILSIFGDDIRIH